jgi:hypothetical protein
MALWLRFIPFALTSVTGSIVTVRIEGVNICPEPTVLISTTGLPGKEPLMYLIQRIMIYDWSLIAGG